VNRLIGIVLFGVLIQSAVGAETLQLGSLPTKRTKLGFMMTVNMEAVSGNGYQPIHLTFAPRAKTFQRDRHVDVAISPVQRFNSTFHYTFRKSITVPEKSGTFTTIVYIPRYYRWTNLKVELSENGRPVKSGSATFGLGNNLRFNFASQQVTVGIIQARDAANNDAPWKVYPDVRTLITVLGEGPIPESDNTLAVPNPVVNRLSHLQAIDLAKQIQPAWVQFRPLEENRLPDNWLGYSQLDVILAAAPVVDRIAAEQPEQMHALRSWLAAGGNLWMYAGNQSKRAFGGEVNLNAVPAHQMLQKSRVSAQLNLASNNDTSKLVYDGWNSAQKESQHYGYRNDQNSMSRRQDVFETLQEAEHPFATMVPAKELAADVRQVSYGLGQVIAISSDDPFPGSFQFWKSIAQMQGPSRLQWPIRNGIDVPQGNDTYWTWLIRSVGQPPVKSFVLLNLLFAIIVGPVCYFFLRRRERLYLLYFVAPCLAALVTGSLFAYALVSDGVTTKQRTRQISWIDLSNDHHVSQSRSTYYRVLGYGQNIQIAGDAAIYPIRHSPTDNPYYGRNSGEGLLHGEYIDSSGLQFLGSGFLPTRNQVQYLTIQPWTSEESIDIDWDSEQVTNHLPQTIRQLLISDDDGKYWEATDLATQSTVTLQRCKQINQRLDRMLGPAVLPDQTEVPMISTYNWGRSGTGSQVSMLEDRLQQWSQHLPKNSFLGIAEIDPQRLGIANARVVDSVHVVMGSLP
jgi:hypothetical protein